jgi:hypothetical protein
VPLAGARILAFICSLTVLEALSEPCLLTAEKKASCGAASAIRAPEQLVWNRALALLGLISLPVTF